MSELKWKGRFPVRCWQVIVCGLLSCVLGGWLGSAHANESCQWTSLNYPGGLIGSCQCFPVATLTVNYLPIECECQWTLAAFVGSVPAHHPCANTVRWVWIVTPGGTSTPVPILGTQIINLFASGKEPCPTTPTWSLNGFCTCAPPGYCTILRAEGKCDFCP